MNNLVNLNDKIVLITGASKGLGKELAVYLSKYGSNLILVARTYESLLNTKKIISKKTGKTPVIIQCDVSNPEDVKNLAIFIKEKYQRLDILINNAGIAFHVESENLGCEHMKQQFEINFYGAFYCIRELLPLIKQSQYGYILNICSIADRVPFSENSIYAATKSALKTYSRGLQLEMRKYGIKVGIFYPGLMKTSFQDDRGENQNKIPSFLILDTKKVVARIKKMIEHRKNRSYMYRWMIWLMKIKLLVS
jgi:short-subunit dehydrogenase